MQLQLFIYSSNQTEADGCPPLVSIRIRMQFYILSSNQTEADGCPPLASMRVTLGAVAIVYFEL